ncbi:MAG: hypothetical protein O2856_00160 [Planctomycetota bacterium]|nr:hypothetical protein [Planctomycetota bacterium]
MTNAHMPRVLIVDGEEGLHTTLRRRMVAEGFDVQVAMNGHQAVEMAWEFLPEILVMDIRTPGFI